MIHAHAATNYEWKWNTLYINNDENLLLESIYSSKTWHFVLLGSWRTQQAALKSKKKKQTTSLFMYSQQPKINIFFHYVLTRSANGNDRYDHSANANLPHIPRFLHFYISHTITNVLCRHAIDSRCPFVHFRFIGQLATQ